MPKKTEPILFCSKKKAQLEVLTQEAADFIFEHYPHVRPVKADFPRGVIRSLASQNKRWPYLTRARQRNVSCVIQLCDINRFHTNAWNVILSGGTMWDWQSSLPVIAVIETLLHEVCSQEGWFKGDIRFKNAINMANSKGVFKQALRDELHELRDSRNYIHIHLRDQPVELCDGKPTQYNRAVKALHKLEKELNTYYEKKTS